MTDQPTPGLTPHEIAVIRQAWAAIKPVFVAAAAALTPTQDEFVLTPNDDEQPKAVPVEFPPYVVREALDACLNGDDEQAARLLSGLVDAQLYAIEGAGSALAIHASRLRTDPGEQAAQDDPGVPELRDLPPEVRRLVHRVDAMRDGWAEGDDGRRRELWRAVHEANDAVWGRLDGDEQPDEAADERLVALLARRDADNARRWEQADAEMTAMRQRAETAERSAAAWQADARRFDENSDHWRKRADEASQERDTAREALDAAGIVIASLRDQRDEQRQRAEVAERERDEARSALDYGAERLYKQLGDATRRADEQKARAQRAEADAADWRTTAHGYEQALRAEQDKARLLATDLAQERRAAGTYRRQRDAAREDAETADRRLRARARDLATTDPDAFREWLRTEIRRDPGWWREILRREIRLGWLRDDFRHAGITVSDGTSDPDAWRP